jgi:two-component system, LytTR family, response regulator
MKTVFVEDTEEHSESIRKILSEFEQVNLVGNANSIESGYELIRSAKPELVLLDVELYPGTSFDLLNRLQGEGKIDFEIIFLTSFARVDYPIRAISYSALDFLMKPIAPEKMKEAIERAEKKISQKHTNFHYQEQIQLLLQNLKNPPDRRSNRIAFHRSGGTIEFVAASDIVYCEAEKDLTHIYLLDNRKFTAMRNLSFYAKPLEIDFNFFRISDKILLNLDYLKTYSHSEDYKVILSNGKTIYASRRGGQDLKQHITDDYLKPTTEGGKFIPNEVEKGFLKNILRKLLE